MADYRYVVVLLSDREAIGSLMAMIARTNASITESCSNEMLRPGDPPPLNWQIGFGIKFYVMDDLDRFDQLLSKIVRSGTIERVQDSWDWMGDASDQ
jgi:hypothetical protein